MTCADRGTSLDTLLDGALSGDALQDLRGHLDQCDACRAELEARRALRQTLRGAFLRSQSLGPGDAFLSRARAAIEKAQTSRPNRTGIRSWIGLAASVLLVAGLAWLVNSRLTAPALPMAMAAISAHAAGDHRDCALHFALEEKPIPLDDAARLYEPAYKGLREAVATSAPVKAGHVQLVEAHACVFHGRRFAHFVFRRNGRVVSLLVTPTSGGSIGGKLPAVATCPASGDLNVACTTAAGYAVFVVSDLPDGDNQALARLLVPAVRAHLVGA